jgi:hypothetical protein
LKRFEAFGPFLEANRRVIVNARVCFGDSWITFERQELFSEDFPLHFRD